MTIRQEKKLIRDIERMKQREIKFRAWHKAEKKMCEVTLLRPNEGAFLVGIAPAGNEIIDLNGKISEVIAPTDGRYCNWDEFELLEWAGFADKKDNDIYEGHIIEVNIGTTSGGYNSLGQYEQQEEIKYLREVTYQNSGLDWKGQQSGTMFRASSRQYFEIIGNIYENPELLKS